MIYVSVELRYAVFIQIWILASL